LGLLGISMKQRFRLTWLLVLGLVLPALACQLPRLEDVGIRRAATPIPVVEQPHATFVPPRQILRARLNEPLQIETYYMSRVRLDALNVWVNGVNIGQPLPAASLSGQAPAFFPLDYATVTFLVNEEIIHSGNLKPRYPTSAWTVPIIWIGHVTGTYDLTVQVTDTASRTQTISQRIEVVAPE
jgi:hypothetical protein